MVWGCVVYTSVCGIAQICQLTSPMCSIHRNTQLLGNSRSILVARLKNCIKNVNYFTNLRFFCKKKTEIHLKIANISLQKWTFPGNEITKFHIFFNACLVVWKSFRHSPLIPTNHDWFLDQCQKFKTIHILK